MRYLFLVLGLCVSCGVEKSVENKNTFPTAGNSDEVSTLEVIEPSGIRKRLFDRPQQMNEYSLKLSWPSVPDISEYRVIRTVRRGGRIGHHPLISVVQSTSLEDSDLIGGTQIIYRIEGLAQNDHTIVVGETLVKVPLDIQWDSPLTGDALLDAIRDNTLNRIVFEKGASVNFQNHFLSIDAQSIVFHGTQFTSFPSTTNASVAGSPGVYGSHGLEGVHGRSGGFLRFRAKSIRGVAIFILNGEDGGLGGRGFVGAPGNDGGGGDISCSQRRGTDGGPGGNGGRGGNGGISGKLYIESNDSADFSYTITGVPGNGARGGEAGAGGMRGVGKTVTCPLIGPLLGYAGSNGLPGVGGGAGVAGSLSPKCLILGKKIIESQPGSCELIHSQTK